MKVESTFQYKSAHFRLLWYANMTSFSATWWLKVEFIIKKTWIFSKAFGAIVYMYTYSKHLSVLTSGQKSPVMWTSPLFVQCLNQMTLNLSKIASKATQSIWFYSSSMRSGDQWRNGYSVGLMIQRLWVRPSSSSLIFNFLFLNMWHAVKYGQGFHWNKCFLVFKILK